MTICVTTSTYASTNTAMCLSGSWTSAHNYTGTALLSLAALSTCVFSSMLAIGVYKHTNKQAATMASLSTATNGLEIIRAATLA